MRLQTENNPEYAYLPYPEKTLRFGEQMTTNGAATHIICDR